MKTEKRDIKSLLKDVRAVSPVIGVILMVAVTVVMAAIIMSWSSGITAPETPKQCGISIYRINSTMIKATVTSIEPVGTGITEIIYTGGVHTEVQVFNASDAGSGNNPARVGAINTTIPLAGPEYVVFVIRWADGTRDILYDAKL